METKDPRAALDAKDLPTQAAGARDLARMGTWEDLEKLLDLATTHKRTGLRLIAAAAAADILHRVRTGAAEASSGHDKDDLIALVKRTDPGLNPSALMLLSAFPEKDVIDRLGRFLRDPRNDVRTGAAVAIRRMAVSQTLIGHPGERLLRAAVGRWLADKRTPSDGLTALILLIGNMGWEEHRHAVFAVSSTSAPVTEAIATARERLDARSTLSDFAGVYVSDGLDALEQDDAPRTPAWMLVHGGHVCIDGGDAQPVEVADQHLRGAGLDAPARLVWIPRLGQHEVQAALQTPTRTWYRLDAADALAWYDTRGHLLEPRHRPAAGALHTALDALEGAVATRAKAMAHLLGGDIEAADEALTSLTNAKKPRMDLYFWLGRLRAEQGRTAEAKAAYEAYLGRAKKKAPFREAAEAAVAGL